MSVLVDCDIHVGYETLDDLLPYLDPPTRELVTSSGTSGLVMPSYPWNHPTGLVPAGPLGRRHARLELRPDLARPPARAAPRRLRRHARDRRARRGGVVLDHPERAARRAALQRLQRLAARAVAPGGAAAARDARRPGAVPGGRGAGDPAARRPGRVRRRLPPGRRRGSRTATRRTTRCGRRRTSSRSRSPYTRTTSASGSASSITAAGMPDTYIEYHTLCGSGMYGHLVSILCQGIFERFPDTRVAMVEGGLVPFVGFLWRLDTNWKACRSEIPWCKQRPSEYVWDHVRFATQPLESPGRHRPAARRDRLPAAVGHADVRERLPALGLRRARADAPAAAGGRGATTCALGTRRSSSGCPRSRPPEPCATAKRACRSPRRPTRDRA